MLSSIEGNTSIEDISSVLESTNVDCPEIEMPELYFERRRLILTSTQTKSSFVYTSEASTSTLTLQHQIKKHFNCQVNIKVKYKSVKNQ